MEITQLGIGTAQIIAIAFLIQTIVENLKPIWNKGKFSLSRILSLLISVLVALITMTNIFSIIGIDVKIKFVGEILTGIIISGGSNVLFDLFNKLKEIKK